MEFITIKDDQNLSNVCELLDVNKDVFINDTLNYLAQNEWIFDASEEWGRTLGEILTEYAKSPLGVCILHLGTNFPGIVDSFWNLVIVGKGDCPMCGSDLEHFEDSGFGKTWEVERCLNCSYESSTEPSYYELFED